MALSLMEEGNTEEDEAVAHIVEVNLKQCASIGSVKGMQCDHSKRGLDQQSNCESHLQITVGLPPDHFFQHHLFSNLATIYSSTLILTCSMLVTTSRMPMIGLVTSFLTKNSTKKAKALALEVNSPL
jgi:hypothetical protein